MTNPLKILLSVVFFTAVLTSGKATENKKQQCNLEYQVDYWTEKLQVKELTPLKENQRILFLSYFNNEPPISNNNPKYVMVYVHTHLNKALVLFKDDGPCINSVHMIPTKIVKEWLTSKGI